MPNDKVKLGVDHILASGTLTKSYPGHAPEELAWAVYQAASMHKSFRGELTPEILKAVQSTTWPGLATIFRGGLDHIVSVDVPLVQAQTNKADDKDKPKSAMSHMAGSPDNGSYYAELWSRGGNWYATTGAAVNQIEDVKKGETIYQVMPKFLAAVNKAACVPCAQARGR